MQILIDDVEASAARVTYNDGLNYGRFDAPNLSVHRYEVELPRSEFVVKLNDEFDRCIRELRHDDEITGEESELAVAGWPPLAALLDMPNLAAATIETFLDRDVFLAFGLGGNTGDYVINSTESVEIREDAVVISGRCFKRIVA